MDKVTLFQSPLYRVSESLAEEWKSEKKSKVSIPSLSGLRVIGMEVIIVVHTGFQSPLYRVSESWMTAVCWF